MFEELMKLDGMKESTANDLIFTLENAGITDAANFRLEKVQNGYELTFISGGKEYKAFLSQNLLFRYLMDEHDKIIWGVTM